MEKVYAIEIINVEECMAFFAKSDKEAIRIAADEYGVKKSDVVIIDSRPATELEIAMEKMSEEKMKCYSADILEAAIRKTCETLFSIFEMDKDPKNPIWFATQQIRDLKGTIEVISGLRVPKGMSVTIKLRDNYSRIMKEMLVALEKVDKKQYDKKSAELTRYFERELPKFVKEQERSRLAFTKSVENVIKIDPSLVEGN